jgi:DHA1 family multidrug resistance protein-like MFS transporter
MALPTVPTPVDARVLDRAAVALLAAAAFTVAIGYGVILPVVPALLERFEAHGAQGSLAWHAGALSATYMLAIFAGALCWGAAADRWGARNVIMLGLAGYAASLGVFALTRSLWVAYVARIAAGAFVSAVVPVSSAYVAREPERLHRVRSMAILGTASLVGFVVGPALSGWLFTLAGRMSISATMASEMAAWPLLAVAGFAVLVLAAAYWVLAPCDATTPSDRSAGEDAQEVRSRTLLAMNLVVTFGLGAMEASLPLFNAAAVTLDTERIASLFAECSLMMIAVQAWLFFAPPFERVRGSRLLLLGFAAMTLGFVLFAVAQSFGRLSLAVGLIAAGSGLLLPALGFIASTGIRPKAGMLFGALTASGTLGQAVGSAAGAWLYGAMHAAAFWIVAALVSIGAATAAMQQARSPPK